MRARSAFSIQKDVIFAIFLREMNARFGSYTLGNVWIILEPIVMMIFFVVLFGLRGRGEFGYVEPPVFVLAGFLPFRLLWQAPMRDNMNAMGGARSLLGFRQIRLFDVFLTRSLVNGGVFLVAGTILVGGMSWLGFNAVPQDPLAVLYFAFVLWLFASFFGILFCVVADFAMEVSKILSIIQMPLLFFSAVFYPMSIVPTSLQRIMAVNPLVHANELIREAWMPMYVSPVADAKYIYTWCLCTMVIAVASYRLRWQRMVAR